MKYEVKQTFCLSNCSFNKSSKPPEEEQNILWACFQPAEVNERKMKKVILQTNALQFVNENEQTNALQFVNEKEQTNALQFVNENELIFSRVSKLFSALCFVFFGIRNLLTKNACLKLSNQLIDRINRLAELEKNVARQSGKTVENKTLLN